MKRTHFYVLCLAFFISCDNKIELKQTDLLGVWKLELDVESEEKSIPFFLEFISENSVLKAAFWNGEEKIVHEYVMLKNDSVILDNPYFNSTIRLKFNRNTVEGVWTDHNRKDYQMRVSGKYNLTHRFKFNQPLNDSIDGKWEVWFGNDDKYKAIGLFNTDQNSMKGTFLTETGDYRFLEGGFGGNSLLLSTFDGAHAFLFDATLKGDTINGWFYSGKHFKEPFVAWRNDTVTLSNPYKLTELVDPEKPVSFSFMDTEGKRISLEDSSFLDKPLIIQIMASWCPNCKDQLEYFSGIQDKLAEQNVEMVALSFERLSYENVLPSLKKVKKAHNIKYPILYAGSADKSVAVKSVPWIKEVVSYPTLLYVLPNRKVFRIHTGFYGPGTGANYKLQVRRIEDDIRNLVMLSK